MKPLQLFIGTLVVGALAFYGCGGPGGGGNCDQNYTTAQLSGCYQSDNASGAVLNYYCFDGAGGYRNDGWSAMTGCSTLHSGQYQLQGCTIQICDETGCSQYGFGADQSGIVIDGDHYSHNNGC